VWWYPHADRKNEHVAGKCVRVEQLGRIAVRLFLPNGGDKTVRNVWYMEYPEERIRKQMFGSNDGGFDFPRRNIPSHAYDYHREKNEKAELEKERQELERKLKEEHRRRKEEETQQEEAATTASE